MSESHAECRIKVIVFFLGEGGVVGCEWLGKN